MFKKCPLKFKKNIPTVMKATSYVIKLRERLYSSVCRASTSCSKQLCWHYRLFASLVVFGSNCFFLKEAVDFKYSVVTRFSCWTQNGQRNPTRRQSPGSDWWCLERRQTALWRRYHPFGNIKWNGCIILIQSVKLSHGHFVSK